MKIGIIGTGNMGVALGTRWARSGHEVLFGSRDPGKAKAAAARASSSAQSGDFDAAAAFGDLVLYTVRGVLPSALLRNPGLLAGKIVVDCNNTDMTSDARPIDPNPGGPTLVELLAGDIPRARVVKAFTSIPHRVIELERGILLPARVAALICSNDADAKSVVTKLAEELGFAAVDCGPLEYSRTVDGATDFLRFQIAKMGLGVFATLSLNVLRPPDSAT